MVFRNRLLAVFAGMVLLALSGCGASTPDYSAEDGASTPDCSAEETVSKVEDGAKQTMLRNLPAGSRRQGSGRDLTTNISEIETTEEKEGVHACTAKLTFTKDGKTGEHRIRYDASLESGKHRVLIHPFVEDVDYFSELDSIQALQDLVGGR